MMRNKTFCHLLITVITSVLIGCSNDTNFTVKGVVAGAGDQILYLENTGISDIFVIDSVKLNADGKFSFKQPRPKYPDFYRFRLKNQLIHFSVDSTETITFVADAHNFATSYSVEGSENCKAIKEITLAQLDADQAIHKFRESYGMNMIPDSMYIENVMKAVKTYKETAGKYIIQQPASTAAYFALFQKVDGLYIYDLYDKDDTKAYGAVATSYKFRYPESPRAKQLEELALQSLKVTRGNRRAALDLKNAQEVNYIDIEFPDINGKSVKLTEVAKDKTVLVNFTAYQTDWSAAFNMQLNELYTKYHNSGFEIYQISLDSDQHFWKNTASKIPWICVRDPQSLYSSMAALYNVRQLPALLLINKNGELKKRIESLDNLENDIKSAI